MASTNGQTETILIVDDEEPIRKTFREWLEGADLHCQILAAADAETALVQANQQTIDLAILDWNLGAGNDGLRLLEDLYLFNPDVVAIMITGYAHQATPLDAMRMGVRDYLDKNQDLDRDTFLRAVKHQLERIRPAKQQRRLHQSLQAFREAVEKVLPLVQTATVLNDPLPLPEAVASLFRFLLQATQARDGVMLIHGYDAERQPAELNRVYDSQGQILNLELVPFARSIAGSAVSMQEPHAMTNLDKAAQAGAFVLQPFEKNRSSLLAAPLAVAPGIHVVVELFDKQGVLPGADAHGFGEADHRLVKAASGFGADLLRQALTQRESHQLLFDAVAAALDASSSVTESLRFTDEQRQEQPPPRAVLDQLRQGLQSNLDAPVGADDTLQLVEAIRVLALRHGSPAVRHCIQLVANIRELLDTICGTPESQVAALHADIAGTAEARP